MSLQMALVVKDNSGFRRATAVNGGVPRVGPANLGNSGMALLLVVTVIALLSVVVIGFSRSMQFALDDAEHFQDEITLETMAHSGIDIGLAVLQSDIMLNDFDSYLENWSLLGEVPVDVGIGEGDVRISIVDLDGRFPINSLVAVAREGKNQEGGAAEGLSPEKAREILLRLLQSELFAVEDEAEATEIVDSLTDWIDENDDELDNGAESSFYDSLEKPIVPRNGPVEFIDELLLVKGVTRDLLYGNDEKQALAEYVNVVNKSNKININTAPAALIEALDDRISTEDVDGIDDFRNDEAHFDQLADSSWFIGYLPADIGGGDLQALLTTQSKHFVIESEARHLERYMNMSMKVERASENEMKLHSFQR